MLAGGLCPLHRSEILSGAILQKLTKHFRHSYSYNQKVSCIKAQLDMSLDHKAYLFPRGITLQNPTFHGVLLSSHTVRMKLNLSTKAAAGNCIETYYDL